MTRLYHDPLMGIGLVSMYCRNFIADGGSGMIPSGVMFKGYIFTQDSWIDLGYPWIPSGELISYVKYRKITI